MLNSLLSDREVEKITGRARSTLQKDRVAGTGIPFVRLGRQVRYRPEDVAAYLAELPSLRSTSEVDCRLGKIRRPTDYRRKVAPSSGAA
jgi:predicted DNA-binding transcriptional regulator AlpA